jgi:hypothetical protein
MLMVTDLESEFMMHKRYSHSIRKMYKKKLPQHEGRVGKLPPIDGRAASEGRDDERANDTFTPGNRDLVT